MSNVSTLAQFRRAGLALLAVTALAAGARAQEAPAVLRVTDALVAEALAANLGLDERTANVDQQLAKLDQVRAEYLPQIDLNLRYSEASGGRTIEVPELGLDFRFLREREQDSYLRLTQPIYDARLAAEKKSLFDNQTRLRQNLQALKGTAEESSLRSRYIQQMQKEEDRVNAIDEELAKLNARRGTLQAELDAMVRTLALDYQVK